MWLTDVNWKVFYSCLFIWSGASHHTADGVWRSASLFTPLILLVNVQVNKRSTCWGRRRWWYLMTWTHSATGPPASEPMKALDAPRSDRTVHELDAFPPRCQRWDKHLHRRTNSHDITSSVDRLLQIKSIHVTGHKVFPDLKRQSVVLILGQMVRLWQVEER